MIPIVDGGDLMQRRFAILGHRAPSSGVLNLNDLAGGSGRMDVLVRAVNAALFVSHGIRRDSHITLHLGGGPGADRRVWFDGESLAGVRPDERSIAGQIKAILKQPVPPIGVFEEITQGIFHTGGNLEDTLEEWAREGVSVHLLEALGSPIAELQHIEGEESRLGFLLSDDRSFTETETALITDPPRISLGSRWLQGHACISIVHHYLDSH